MQHKLTKEPELFAEYHNIIQEQLHQGNMEEVPPTTSTLELETTVKVLTYTESRRKLCWMRGLT